MAKRTVIRTLLLLGLCLIVIPGLIVLCLTQWGNRRHLIVSSIVLTLTMLPFFLRWEFKKPQAREMVLLAVLTAMGIAGRQLFVWLPQGKPVAALVMIVGATLGAESGFLTGAAIAFFSNFLFTQGPWTPWQMAAFGALGLVSGLIFYGRDLPPKRPAMRALFYVLFALFGGAAVMTLYGGLVDGSTLMMYGDRLSAETVLTVYTLAIPYNAIHAGATVAFLLIGGPLMFRV
ncbi:MAG: ECF transporter S component, partial [Clostridia bacterium]|nr:ECF transporter S component [Clostridia bacterium]